MAETDPGGGDLGHFDVIGREFCAMKAPVGGRCHSVVALKDLAGVGDVIAVAHAMGDGDGPQ